jgi:hypothetical protein
MSFSSVCISSIVRLCYLARIDNNDITCMQESADLFSVLSADSL